jgi:hypothetical protein
MKKSAEETIRKIALVALELYGGAGPEHGFTTTDFNLIIHERGLTERIGLYGQRSVCAAIQRCCPGSKRHKASLPVAF